MAESDHSDMPRLIRRVRIGDELREFAHPLDGSAATERPVGSVTPQASEGEWLPPSHDVGQFDWQEVSAEMCVLPMHLPLLKASCDASGACCALHHHLPVTLDERQRIFALMEPEWQAPEALDVLVHRAYDSGSDPSYNIASIDGTCTFQRGDGLCELHVRGGPLAKPMPCRSFPSMLVLCGEEWHASLRPECACLQRTAIEGTLLSSDSEAWLSLRSHQRWVASVPQQLSLCIDRQIDRADYLVWLRQLIATLGSTFEPIVALRQAAVVLAVDRQGGLSVDDAQPPQAWLDEVVMWIQQCQDTLGEAWSPRSAYWQSIDWAVDVARQVASDAGISAPAWSRGRSRDWSRRQASLLSLLLHGHGLLDRTHLIEGIVDLGHLAWLARAANAVQPIEEREPRLESMTLWMFLWRTLFADR